MGKGIKNENKEKWMKFSQMICIKRMERKIILVIIRNHEEAYW